METCAVGSCIQKKEHSFIYLEPGNGDAAFDIRSPKLVESSHDHRINTGGSVWR